jgi:Dullard-like phosphatase family protein
LESISSFKSSTESTLNCIEFFCSHNSFFELINSNEKKNNNNNDIIPEIMTEIKIFEIINFFLILFILHIILETKIEYIDNFNEDDIVKIYTYSVDVIKKIYEIIIFILQLNEKNNINNINTNNTSKFIKEFYKKETKLIYTEQIINKINNNISYCLNTLFNACNILFGNLILFKKDSGNIDIPDEIEKKFLSQQKLNITNKANNNEKIYLSKEFNDQYNSFKMIYLYFTKNNFNKIKSSSENYNFLSNSEITSIITEKLSSVYTSFKEISNNFILYYTNFKILLEKNKVKPPFLGPPSNPNKIFTLVVDLDETLVHYVEEESRAYVQVRPYADFFLNEMGKYFEIVIFTAAAEDYADIVLNELDKNNIIDYKLYRKHTEQINGVFIKDLSKLGRDINKIVIIDNNKDNFSLQPENGLHICSFLGDQDDDELYLLTEDLMKIVKGNKKDIRPAVKEIDSIMKKRYKNKNVILE